jgi:hypothetical protein
MRSGKLGKAWETAMTETSIDYEKALLDPKAMFASPAEVVRNKALSREQKIKVLEAWEHDARQLMTATAENMSGGEEPQLRQVHEALRKLNAEIETPAKAARAPSV